MALCLKFNAVLIWRMTVSRPDCDPETTVIKLIPRKGSIATARKPRISRIRNLPPRCEKELRGETELRSEVELRGAVFISTGNSSPGSVDILKSDQSRSGDLEGDKVDKEEAKEDRVGYQNKNRPPGDARWFGQLEIKIDQQQREDERGEVCYIGGKQGR